MVAGSRVTPGAAVLWGLMVATMVSVLGQQIGNSQAQPSNAPSTPAKRETNPRQSSSSRYCVQRCFRQGFAPPQAHHDLRSEER